MQAKDEKKEVSSVLFTMSEPDTQVIAFMSRIGFDYTVDVDSADIAVFPGGADVTPFLYGEKALPTTYSNINRDRQDIKFFKSLPVAMPKVGICRGAQFLNVMGGGTLWQHVDNHAGVKGHVMRDEWSAQDQMIHVTSTHHQMMRPPEHAVILARASEAMHKHADGEHIKYTNGNKWDDVEVLYLDNINAVCYQPHPEYGGSNNKANQKYFFEVIDCYLLTAEQSACVKKKALQRTGKGS